MINPVTYQVHLMRHAFGRGAEFPVGRDLLVLLATTAAAFALTAVLFDPEQRFVRRSARSATGA